jgi:predicted acyltransferase
MTTAPAPVAAPKPRLASLDQFRGYTVAGMFLVNFLSGFWAAPFLCHHHNTFCSYADTIMPQFFFAVGFSMRLSFGRRVMQQGAGAAYWHMVKRLFGLALVAIFISYPAEPSWPKGAPHNWETLKELGVWGALWPGAIKHTWFQTLLHIAVTSLWILPVIRLSAIWRVLYLVVSALLHLALSAVFNCLWVNGAGPYAASGSGIDGGPLGFLSWTIPTLVGTLACDVALNPDSSSSGKFMRLFIWGVVLMALGWLASCATRMYDLPNRQPRARPYAFSRTPVFPAPDQVQTWMDHLKAREWSKVLAEPPFVPPPFSREEVISDKKEEPKDLSYQGREWNYWMMSQRSGSISYLTFGAGLSLVIFGVFYVLADVIGLKIGIFRTLGVNALAGYVLHDFTAEAVKKFLPHETTPANAMWIGFAVFFFVTWLFMRSLEKQKIYIKL